MPRNIEISVIVVHYGHGGEVFKCLDSLEGIKDKLTSAEFILVDNNDEKLEYNKIKTKYPWVKYLQTPKNLGWGGGHNYGIRYSIGKYILALDSDILIDYKSFKHSYDILKNNNKIGLVSPRLINISGKFTPGATLKLTPLIGIFYLSFINKILPGNLIVRNYLMSDWDRKTSRIVEAAQLGAFLIRRITYEDIGGFDESFFLYFEEYDISQRLKKMQWQILFDAKSEAIHLESKGTPKEKIKIKEVFANSRFYYFRKYYGLFWAIIIDKLASISFRKFFIKQTLKNM
jgi:O-antigen biosynthesis protein